MSRSARVWDYPAFVSDAEIIELKVKAAISYIKQLNRSDIHFIPKLCSPNFERMTIYINTDGLKPGKARYYVKMMIENYFSIYRVRPDGYLRRLKCLPKSIINEKAQAIDKWRCVIDLDDLDKILHELNFL